MSYSGSNLIPIAEMFTLEKILPCDILPCDIIPVPCDS